MSQLMQRQSFVNGMHHETFFLKNHTQNEVENLLPDPFLKNQN